MGDTHITSKLILSNPSSLELSGDATVWDDLRVSLNTARLPASNYPEWKAIATNGGSVGVGAYHFTDGEYVFLKTQFPHSYKEGSTIYPHIHYMCATGVDPADNFGIGVEYVWYNIGDTIASSVSVERDISTGVSTAKKASAANIVVSGISGTSKSISSIFDCRLYRKAASSDNFGGEIIITDFDIHYEMDTLGSNSIWSK